MISTRDFVALFCIALFSTGIALALRNQEVSATVGTIESFVQTNEFQFDTVDTIALNKNGKSYVFVLTGREWWQELPFKMRMDTVSMQSVIKTVESLQKIADVEDGIDVETLGFGSANSIALTSNEHTLLVQLGRKTLGARAYAIKDTESPVLVDQSLHRLVLDVDTNHWRDIRLFPDFAIDGVRIQREVNGDTLLLDRSSGRWEMLQPVSARVDQNILLEWVGRLAAARIGSFVQDEPKDLAMFGLHNPLATFEVEDGKGTVHTALVGGRVSAGSQDRYVMLEGRPVVFKMQWEALSELFPASEIFVDATGSAVSKYDIKQVVLHYEGKELVFERNLETWVDEHGILTDNQTVETLLTWLLDTKPPQVSIGAYPRSSEVATVTFIGYNMKPLDTVRIATHQDGKVIIENGDNVLRIHPEDSIAALEPFTKK